MTSSVADRICALIRSIGSRGLRISLALVFIWFGALKVVDLSPVSDLVTGSIPATDSSLLVPLLGGFEVALGLGLIAGRHPVVVTAAIVHLAGTFLVLITQPELAFQNGNPLLLTTEGEFVVKNLVLLAAAVAVADAGVEHRAQAAESLTTGGLPWSRSS
jgi:uncharacterized membrane protein YkgB